MEKEFQNKILTISGEPASGKSTVIKELVKSYKEQGFNVNLISIGELFRQIAKEKKLSIQELNEYMKTRANIDKLIDNQVRKQGEIINSTERPNDIYIFDSRLAWHNIPNSFAIRLTVNDEIAGKRVFEDNSRGQEDKYSTIQEAIDSTAKRKHNEIQRYKQRYNIDLTNPDNYNLIINTSYMNINEIAELIILNEKNYRNNISFKKEINNSIKEELER